MSTDSFADLATPVAATTTAKVVDVRSTAYKLQVPVSVDGVEHREIRIGRVTTGDRAKFDRSVGPQALKNVVRLLRTPEGVPLSLDAFGSYDALDGAAILDLVEPILAPHFPPAPPAPTFSGENHRKTVFLGAPLDYNGKFYDRIDVRRLTAREFQTYFALPADERGMMPAFYGEDGARVPDVVIQALSFEDTTAIGEAMDAFMPRALKADRAPQETSAPESGETSPQS